MTAPGLVCLTNIPTPYRLFLFRRMHERLRERGWEFEAWFMGSSESNRHWTFANSDFQFPYRFLGRARFRIGSNTLYWNHEIRRVLRDTRPDILLISGAWIHPTTLLATASSHPKRKIFWSESHLGSIRYRGFVTAAARRCMLSRFSEFAVPGTLARGYVEHHSPGAQIYYLPNLVDPTVFEGNVRMYKRSTTFGSTRGKYDNRKVLLIVARLVEEKGLLPFLEGIGKLSRQNQSKLAVRIAGSGRLRKPLEHSIARQSVDVRLIGQKTASELAELYAQADGFCLPSLSDPNPISVIEAMWAGLPLLLSSRVGNYPECLDHGRNGFLFDSRDPESIANAISRWLALSPAALNSFGEKSLQIARSEFDPDTVVSNFLDDVLQGSASRPESQLESTTASR